MSQYVKIFNTHDEYDEYGDKPVISHCVKGVHIHDDNQFNYGSDDDDPTPVSDEDYDLDAGYFD